MAPLNYLRAHGAARDEGQGVIEYTLVVGVISMALYVAFQTTGIVGQIQTVVGNIVTTMGGS